MALVAYGSSDDSDTSDNEDNVTVAAANTNKTNLISQMTPQTNKESLLSDSCNVSNGQISSEKTQHTPTNKLLDIEPKYEDNVFSGHISDDDDDNFMPKSLTSSGLNLPAPKNEPVTLSNPLENDLGLSSSSDLLAGLPQPKAASYKGKTGLIDENEEELEDFVKKKEIPIEQPPLKQKNSKIKITIPNLPDSDEDEDEPSKKRVRSSKGSLFSMLPAPMHATLKENKRSLVPHAIMRKTTKVLVSSHSSTQPTSKVRLVAAEDSDEEDTSGNFFFLGTTDNRPSLPTSSTSAMSALAASPMPASTPTEPTNVEDAPLEFKSSAGPSGYSSRAAMSASQQYNLANVDIEAEPQQEIMAESSDTDNQEASDELTDTEQLMRLAGKAAFRREKINIIDVQQADPMSREELLKNLSEEQPTHMAYQRQSDKPEHMSKRKHQITYLGQLAKQRELELKNQWAQNRVSKKMSAMKYGF